jgi:hypothetical protein
MLSDLDDDMEQEWKTIPGLELLGVDDGHLMRRECLTFTKRYYSRFLEHNCGKSIGRLRFCIVQQGHSAFLSDKKQQYSQHRRGSHNIYPANHFHLLSTGSPFTNPGHKRGVRLDLWPWTMDAAVQDFSQATGGICRPDLEYCHHHRA